MLRKTSVILMMVGLIGLPGLSLSGEEKLYVVPEGFITGQEYINHSKIARVSYVMGLQDGLSMAMLLGGEYLKVKWWQSCAVGKTNYQLVAMFSKFLRDHPERWHEDAHTLYYSMMCKYHPWEEYERTHKLSR